MKKLITALLACVMAFSALTAVTFAAELKETTVTRENIFTSTVDGVKLSAKPINSAAAPKDFALNSDDDSVTWSNVRESTNAVAETRIEATVTDGIKLYKGRKYSFKADLSAADSDGKAVSDVNMYWLSEEQTFSFQSAPWADISTLGENGRAVISTKAATAADDGKISVLRFLNKSLKGDASAVRFVTLHSVSADETITYCDTAFSVGSNGSASIANYADRDGGNAVSDVLLENGAVKQFEKYSTPSFNISADSGYVIDSLSFAGKEISAASGLQKYSFTASETEGTATFAVTFKKNDSVEERKNFAYITLSGNKTLYAGESANSVLSVKGYDADGTETILTGSEFLTYKTSNPLTFTVDSGIVKSTDNYGMAVISAEYENNDGTTVSASVIFQRSQNPKLFASQSCFETTHNFFADTPGHVDGTTTCLAWNGLEDTWQLRAYEGGNKKASGFNWKENTHRVMTGWFYDDGKAASRPGFTMFYKNFYESNKQTAFSYSETIGTASETHYSGNSVARTKGWHQVVVTIDTRGARNIYIDGVPVSSDQLTPNCTTISDDSNDYKNGASYVEMRCTNNKENPGYLYDDFSISEYTNIKPEYSVKINAEGGSVSAGGVPVGDGKSAELTAARGGNITLSCDQGFEIVSVERVDSLFLTEGANTPVSVSAKEYTVSDITDDLIYNVVVKKTSSEPSVSADKEIIASTAKFTYAGEDGSVTVPDGTLSLVAYAAFDSSAAEISECGFEISMYNDGVQVGKSIVLPAISVPTSDGRYAIRTFGAGIKSGSEYKIRPYIVVNGNAVYGNYVSKEA